MCLPAGKAGESRVRRILRILRRRFLSQLLQIPAGGDALDFFEIADEGGGVVVSDELGDLGDGILPCFQKHLRLSDLRLRDVLEHAHAGDFTELLAQGGHRHVEVRRHTAHRQVIARAVLLDVRDQLLAKLRLFLAVAGDGQRLERVEALEQRLIELVRRRVGGELFGDGADVEIFAW